MIDLKKAKLKHDVLNSIVIINGMTQSAEKLIFSFENSSDDKNINQNKLNKLTFAMHAIREQMVKIESYFALML